MQSVMDLFQDLNDQFRAAGFRYEGCFYSTVLTPDLKKAASNLRENPGIVIRCADKSNTFLVLNRSAIL